MKAIIQIDVPEHQIGQEVSVYFKDTMCVKSVCTPLTESDDCVSREEAIKAIDNVLSEYSIYFLFRDRCTEALMLLPSVQPNQEKHDEEIIKETVESVWGKPPYTEVLDKIRAEIIELRSRQNVGVLECLDIIDKYRKGDKE